MVSQITRAAKWLAWILTTWALLMTTAADGDEAPRAEQASSMTSSSRTETLRLRLAWGGGQATAWKGKLQAIQGELTEAQPLGADPETPGMFSSEKGTGIGEGDLTIEPLRPQLYQVLDITLKGTEDTRLRIELRAEATSPSFSQEIPFVELRQAVTNVALDAAGSRLLIQRAPGDLLAVETGRDHLVFGPSEPWSILVRPKPTQASQDPQRLTAELSAASGGPVIWRTQQLLRPNEQGGLPDIERLEIRVPETDGVYNLLLKLVSAKNASPFASVQEIQRKIQFVVCDPAASVRPGMADWREVISVDPSQPRWWERLRPVTSWNRMTGALGEMLRSGQAVRGTIGSRSCMTIPPQGWQAYPLLVSRLDQPHLVELEYLVESPQATSLCIYEADEAGNVYSRAAAGGFHSQAILGTAGQGINRYRLLFWPRTRNPILLLSNQHDKLASHLVRYRVLAGPGHLPALFPTENRIGLRQSLAYFDDPNFMDMFGAPDAPDPESGRFLTDWTTFQTSANRLTEYLRYTGESGASIPILSDGGSLYPDRELLSGSRFDNGAYFSDGRDPLPKDVCELIFRQFDREGLSFIPAMRFTGLLPELERDLKGEEGAIPGIELVHRDGMSWRQQRGIRRGNGAFYNPLDERVQQRMIGIIRRFVDRYGQHPSFRGMRIDLLPECSMIPPDLDWGMDLTTRTNFRVWLAQTKPGASLPRVFEPDMLLEDEWRNEWQAWRSERLTQLYRGISNELRRVRPEAVLYVSPVRLTYASPLRSYLEPTLPPRRDMTSGLLRLGLDVRRLQTIPGLVMLYPQILPSSAAIRERATPYELANDSEFHEVFPKSWASHPVLYQRAFVHSWPAGVSISPEKGGLLTNSPPACLIPLDRANGKMPPIAVSNLAARDAQVLFVGGSRPSLGNLESLQSFNQILRQLPVAESTLLESSIPKSPYVRKLTRGNQTFLVAMNDTFWPQDIRIEFSSSSAGTPTAIVRDPSLSDIRRSSSGWEWKCRLDAKDLAAIRIPSADLQILSTEQIWPQDLSNQLTATVTGLVRSIGALHDPLPLAVPENASFEKNSGEEIEDWEANHVVGVTVARDDAQFHEGAASARLDSNGPNAWIRSRPFAVPQTGRISLKVWLKVDPTTSAPIRLACEGILDGQPYYRFAQIDPTQLKGTPDAWNPFVLVIDDLPATGMRELRTRVDLLGQGKIWIDAIQAFDLSFLPEELT